MSQERVTSDTALHPPAAPRHRGATHHLHPHHLLSSVDRKGAVSCCPLLLPMLRQRPTRTPTLAFSQLLWVLRLLMSPRSSDKLRKGQPAVLKEFAQGVVVPVLLGAPFSSGAQEGFWGCHSQYHCWAGKWGRFSVLQHRKNNSYYSWKAKALLTMHISKFWLWRDHPWLPLL